MCAAANTFSGGKIRQAKQRNTKGDMPSADVLRLVKENMPRPAARDPLQQSQNSWPDEDQAPAGPLSPPRMPTAQAATLASVPAAPAQPLPGAATGKQRRASARQDAGQAAEAQLADLPALSGIEQAPDWARGDAGTAAASLPQAWQAQWKGALADAMDRLPELGMSLRKISGLAPGMVK